MEGRLSAVNMFNNDPEDDREKATLLSSFRSKTSLRTFIDLFWSTQIKMQFYESLDYENIDNELSKKELRTKSTAEFRKYYTMHWVVVFFIGFLTAMVGFCIDLGVTSLQSLKFQITNKLIDTCENDHCVWSPFLVYIAFNVAFVAMASALVNFVEPAAAGSGIPEVKSYLNGVKIPRIVRMKTLAVKAVGVLLALSGGLVVGKAAPMIHIGAIIAAGVSQGQALSFSSHGLGFLKYYRSDQEKRDFVSAGAAAGVAAAFGAPIGGVLFSIEDGASFWKQSLLWRTFFCSMISTFTLNFFLSGIGSDGWGNLSQSGLVSFGAFQGDQPGYNVQHIPFFLLLGVFGGLFGALLNALNVRFYRLRQMWTQKKSAKVVEAVLIAFITASFSFLISYLVTVCKPLSDDMDDTLNNYRFYCPVGQYNEMASLFFNTQEKSIKELFHNELPYSLLALTLFFIVYYFLALITFGAAIPSGLFVPGLLIGCAYGRLAGEILEYWVPQLKINPGTFALLGAAAMLGGIFRMTISLTVILVETTNDISYGLPIMVTLMAAKWVGDFFNKGIYDTHITVRKIPYLGWDSPLWMRKFKASDIMSTPVRCFKPVARVKKVIQVLKETTHNGFPIRDKQGHYTGLILRSQLVVMLEKKEFLTNSREKKTSDLTLDDFRAYYPRYPDITEILVEKEDEEKFLDLRSFMNPLPFSIQSNATLSRTFRLFRTMGQRHLVVVDEDNRIVGMITRKDLAYLEERYFEDSPLNHVDEQ